MHKLTLKKLVRPSSYGTRFSSADVYIDDIMIGYAHNYGSPDEITFYPNTHGDAYLANFISISKLFELIKAVAADKAVDAEIAEIAEIAETKAIFINAKDNTMSYILLDYSYSPSDSLDSRDRDKIDKYIYSVIGYKSLSDFTEIVFEEGNAVIYVDCIDKKIVQGDWGFFTHANLNRIDYQDYFYDHYFYKSEYTEYDGTYETFIGPPNSFGGYRFIGNAVIITNDFTLEQLSQMVKSFYMKKIDDPDAVLPRYDLVEHSSHPKIITLDDFSI